MSHRYFLISSIIIVVYLKKNIKVYSWSRRWAYFYSFLNFSWSFLYYSFVMMAEHVPYIYIDIRNNMTVF